MTLANNPERTMPTLQIGFWFLLALAAIAGAASLIYSLPYGPGLVNDSVVYIGGAENIMAGNGYSRTSGGGEVKPITINAPLYPLAIAAFSLAGMTPITAAEVISILTFGCNIFLFGWLLKEMTASPYAGLLAGVLFAVTEANLRAHSFALAEPLVLVFCLASLLCLAFFLRNSKTVMLVLAAVLCSLAYLTRYVGLVVLAGEALALLLVTRGYGEKIKNAIVFTVIGALGAVAWFLRNLLVSGNPANRVLMWHPVSPDRVQDGIQNFWEWLLPDRLGLLGLSPAFWTLALVVFFSGVVFIGWRLYRQGVGNGKDVRGLIVIFTSLPFLHLAVLLFSICFTDASIAIENRNLVMVYLSLSALFVFVLQLWWRRKGFYKPAAAILAVVVVLSFAYDTRRTMIDLHVDGQGYSSSYYRNSATIEAVRKLPSITLYSNRVQALNLLADRPAYALLAPIDPLTLKPRPNYQVVLDNIKQVVFEKKALLVVFEARQTLEDPVEGAWFRDLIKDIPMVVESSDGIIYGTLP